MSEWAKEDMCDERAGRDDLERRLAELAEEFDPVPSSVLDAARAAFAERKPASKEQGPAKDQDSAQDSRRA